MENEDELNVYIKNITKKICVGFSSFFFKFQEMLFVFFDIVSFFLKKGSKKGNVRKKKGRKKQNKKQNGAR